MAIEPILYLVTVLVILAVILRARKVATGRALSDRQDPDEWAEEAMFMHYMEHGTTDPYAR